MKKARYKECDAFYQTEVQKSSHFDDKPHTYFVIKMLDNIQPGTDQRKSVGLVVTDSELAPKLNVQWPWRPVTKLAHRSI